MPFIITVFVIGLTQLHFISRKEHEAGNAPHVPLTKNMEYDDMIIRWIRGDNT